MANDIPEDLARALDDRYELRGLLGRGGMATVYLANDRKHHRVVAIKVLRPEVASSLGAERFLKEIQIVAQLTHPHILAMHDSGECHPERRDGAPEQREGSFVYYVMPHIEGGSLRQVLDRDGTLDTARALELAAPVADALAYAHSMGVFHRDIKPENILLSHGHPIVADFGIAKAVSTASGRNLTRTGLALGTPGYMSPEQAAGFSDLDARTDVYSLAVVIYEMLVGEIPGRWPTDEAARAGRFLEAPAAHRSRLAGAGSTVESALVRAMAIQQSQRTDSPARLMADLRGIAAPRRKYRADEVDAIVKKASEMEASNPTGGAMTIGGVEDIAAEVGIAPALVRSAARSLAARQTPMAPSPIEMPKRNWFLGGATRVVCERVVDGELDEAGFPVVIDEIRMSMRNVGQAGQLGKSLSWTMTRAAGVRRDVEVLVSARGGRTRVTVQENMGQVAGVTFGPIGGGMGGGGMALVAGAITSLGHPELIGFALPVWAAITWGTARTFYKSIYGRHRREIESLADRLEALLQDLINEQPR